MQGLGVQRVAWTGGPVEIVVVVVVAVVAVVATAAAAEMEVPAEVVAEVVDVANRTLSDLSGAQSSLER